MKQRTFALLYAAVLSAVALSCSEDTAELVVTLRTDLVPLVEFDEVRTALRKGALTSDATDLCDRSCITVRLASDAGVEIGEALAGSGLRAAEFSGRKPGRYKLRVSMYKDGAHQVSKDLDVSVSRSVGIPVFVSRRCFDAQCPPGVACLDGVCVGAIADAGVCDQDGGCALETACADGVDNDGDGRIDCDDNDCIDQPCDDGLKCTTKDVCTQVGTCKGRTRTCIDVTGGCAPRSCDEATGKCGAGKVKADGAKCGSGPFQQCCGGACVNSAEDRSHCGACGVQCGEGLSCETAEHGRPACRCLGNADCSYICSTVYGNFCSCTLDQHCAGGQTCVDVDGGLNYCE